MISKLARGSFANQLRKSTIYNTPTYGFAIETSGSHEVDVLFKNNFISLKLQLPNQFNPKHFFINSDFSFRTFSDILRHEHKGYEIEYDFSGANTSTIDEDSKITTFLDSDTPGKVGFSIDGEEYVIRNTATDPLYGALQDQLVKASNDSDHVFFWYKKCLESNIQPSHAGALSYFMRSVKKQITAFEKKKGGVSLTETELEQIFKNAIEYDSESTVRKMDRVLHHKNEVESQILLLESEKKAIEDKVEKKIYFYEYLILGLSLTQLVSFYYMIFHVDWLGWDIVEPVTYSVQCFTLLLGMRFFWKYGSDRSLESIRKHYTHKMINKNRPLRERYNFVNKQLQDRLKERDLCEDKINLYYNRKNYSQFLLNE